MVTIWWLARERTIAHWTYFWFPILSSMLSAPTGNNKGGARFNLEPKEQRRVSERAVTGEVEMYTRPKVMRGRQLYCTAGRPPFEDCEGVRDPRLSQNLERSQQRRSEAAAAESQRAIAWGFAFYTRPQDRDRIGQHRPEAHIRGEKAGPQAAANPGGSVRRAASQCFMRSGFGVRFPRCSNRRQWEYRAGSPAGRARRQPDHPGCADAVEYYPDRHQDWRSGPGG